MKCVKLFLSNDGAGAMAEEGLHGKVPAIGAGELGKVEGEFFEIHESWGIPVRIVLFGVKVDDTMVLVSSFRGLPCGRDVGAKYPALIAEWFAGRLENTGGLLVVNFLKS